MELKINYKRHMTFNIKFRDKLLNSFKISKFIYD